MKLYEIDEAIVKLFDEDTGECIDYEKFDELQMAREEKIENLCLYAKNLTAEAKAVKEEADNLQDRAKSLSNKAESVKRYLAIILDGEKFSTSKVAVSWRKSTKTEVDDNFVDWAKATRPELLKYAEPTPNRTNIALALKSGEKFEFARLCQNKSMLIK